MKIGDSLEMVEDSNLNSTISGKKLKVLHFFYNLFESSIFFRRTRDISLEKENLRRAEVD